MEVSEINLANGTLIYFYEDLFTTCRLDLQPESLSHILSWFLMRLLSGVFMALEIYTALKQMAPMKAPSLDGMPKVF